VARFHGEYLADGRELDPICDEDGSASRSRRLCNRLHSELKW